MRTLTYYVAVSLDGRIAGPGDDIAAFDFPSELAGWIVEHLPETLPAPARAAMGIDDLPNQRFDSVLMGRNTWELGRREGLTSPYPQLRQVVVSSSLAAEASVDPGIEVVSKLDADGVDDLLGSDGETWLCGGGILAGSLAGRIDRLVLKRQPIVLGEGPMLFDHPHLARRFVADERLDLGPVAIETFTRADST